MRKIILIVISCITLVVLMLGEPQTAQAQSPTPTTAPGSQTIYKISRTIDFTVGADWEGTRYGYAAITATDPMFGISVDYTSVTGGAGSCWEKTTFDVYSEGEWDSRDGKPFKVLGNGSSYIPLTFGSKANFITSRANGYSLHDDQRAYMPTGTVTNFTTRAVDWPAGCLGAHVTVTVSVWMLGPNGENEPYVCVPTSYETTTDILPIATVTAGSLKAVQTIDDPARGNFESVIDVTLSANLPRPVTGSGIIPASIQLVINNGADAGDGGGIPTGQMSPIYVTINDVSYSFSGYSSNVISLPSGTQALTIRVQATITGPLADHYTYPPPQLAFLAINAPLVNNGDTVICDGSYEWPLEKSPWQRVNELYTDGRLQSFIFTGDLLNGSPACGLNWYQAGKGVLGVDTYTPTMNLFKWYGGVMYWKFRYRTTNSDLFNVFSNWKGSPNVYLVTENGNFIMDLYGANVYNSALDSNDWKFVTGTIGGLAAGKYRIVMDLGYNQASISKTARVYYDDVAVGQYAYPNECSTWLSEDPATATPVPSVTATGGDIDITSTVGTPDIPSTNTPAVTNTPNVLPSIRPSFTATVSPTVGTPRATNTPRASVTPQKTATNNPSTITALAPTLTRTPYGVPQSTSTAPPAGTQVSTPGPGTTPNPDLPPGPGIGNNPGTGDYVADCSRPTNWYSLAWWFDYERCVALSFITFGPSSQATAIAIPQMFTKYEPFGTIKEVGDGLITLRTQVATYAVNAGDRAPGTGDAINPSAPLKGGPGTSPWDGNLNLHYVPSSGGINTGMGMTAFDTTCATKISSALPGALGYGVCFVFGVARGIGLTPWMQFFLNICAIFMPIRAALSLVGMGGQVAYVARDLGGDTSGYQKAVAESNKVPKPAPFRFGRRSKRS